MTGPLTGRRSDHGGRRRWFATALLAGTTGIMGCGDSSPETAATTRDDSAGVTIVRHGAADRALDWIFEERFRLGGADSGPESFYHVLRETVGVDAEDRIYLLDIVAQRVVVFAPDGGYLRTLGAPGSGPGEFGSATGLYVAPDGTVDVYDFRKTGLVRFAPDGAVLTEQRFAASPRGYFARHAGGLLVSWSDRRSLADSIVSRLVLVRGADTTALSMVSAPRRERVQFPSCNTVPFVLGPVFEPDILWGRGPDQFVVAALTEYRIDRFREGRLVQSVRRSTPPLRATRALAVEHLGRGLPTQEPGRDVCYVAASRVVDQVGFAEWVPPIAAMTVAPDGAVWVSRTTIGDTPPPIDVFDGDGRYVGTLPPATPQPLAFLQDGTVLAAELDDVDVERLVVYAVRDGAP